jgi:hypothetical protein
MFAVCIPPGKPLRGCSAGEEDSGGSLCRSPDAVAGDETTAVVGGFLLRLLPALRHRRGASWEGPAQDSRGGQRHIGCTEGAGGRCHLWPVVVNGSARCS